MKLFEILQDLYEFTLFEDGRIYTLKQLYANRLDAKLASDGNIVDANKFIDKVASYDPTSKKIYVQWLLNSYLKGVVKAEDLYKSHDDLVLFDKFKNKLAVKDINKYTPTSLYQAVEYIDPESASSKRQEKQQIKTEGADVIMKGPDCTILKLKTKEAACYYGRQTRWCTAATDAENMFDHYNERGPLYVAMCEDGRKFQFHIESSQFMDEQDEKIDVSQICMQYPTIDKFFNEVVSPRFLEDADEAFMYASFVIKRRWPEGEPIIMQSPRQSYFYARDIIEGRWPEAEPYIMKDCKFAYFYAKEVIQGRWPEAEPYIMENEKIAYDYALDVIKGRWPEAEPIILNSIRAYDYKRRFGLKLT
jgi:hypothetical protein